MTWDKPLADRIRPSDPQAFYGQKHLLDPGKPIYAVVHSGQLHSMIFWGPPGTGKTTLARMIAQRSNALFLPLSAVLAGVKDIREAVSQAKFYLSEHNQRTILFVDEVHRFNKSQQDAFLPHVEDGTVFFIGATTENPSFELNNALLSRARVYILKALTENDLLEVMNNAISDTENGFGAWQIEFPESLKSSLIAAADGDARRLLNLVEIAVGLGTIGDHKSNIEENIIDAVLEGGVRRFDKHGEDFYNQISALHKSVRGSAPDAALYWFCRMLDGGCDPLYLARRIVRIASEDIGNADPRALQLSLNAWETQERLGSPEGELALAQAVIYLACAPKSNAVYKAFKMAMDDARKHGSIDVPRHLRNAPTGLMKNLDYGKDYRYAHDEPEAYAAGEVYFPKGLENRRYYDPVPRGLEVKIREKLQYLKELDKKFHSNSKV